MAPIWWRRPRGDLNGKSVSIKNMQIEISEGGLAARVCSSTVLNQPPVLQKQVSDVPKKGLTKEITHSPKTLY